MQDNRDLQPPVRLRNAKVDLLKGIAIFFVIFFHCYYHTPDALLQPVRNVYLHIFFFIAGLFFSLKADYGAFVRSKIHRLLVPYVFFVVLSAAVFLICPWSWPEVYNFEAPVSSNVFYFVLLPANQPVWFVMSLFWLSMLYYVCKRCVPSPWRRGLLVLLLAVPGYFLSARYNGALSEAETGGLLVELAVKAFYMMHIPIALAMLPYIFLGDMAASECGILALRLRGLKRWLPMIAACAVWIAASQTSDVSLYYYYLGNNLLLNNLASLAGIIFLWLLVQNVAHPVPLFSFLGRYSLVALGTHYIIFFLLKPAGICGTWLCFVIDLPATLVFMRLIIRFFPRFVALK